MWDLLKLSQAWVRYKRAFLWEVAKIRGGRQVRPSEKGKSQKGDNLLGKRDLSCGSLDS